MSLPWSFNHMLAIVALVLILITGAVVFGMLIVVHLVAKKQKSISNTTEIFPIAIQMVTYSEIPISIVAVIANYLEIPLSEVIEAYSDDAKNRRSIVLTAFRKDPVTDRFIQSYKSKFIKNGYVGEQLLKPT